MRLRLPTRTEAASLLEGVLGWVMNGGASVPAAIPRALVPQKLRVSSGVAQGNLIQEARPQYPPQIARQACIQGTVVLDAMIGKDGSVQNLHVKSGNPMLAQAAMDAVKKWRYKPYLLNGTPVEVDTQY